MKRISFKAILLIILCVVYGLFEQAYMPLINNSIAVKQMDATNNSFANYSMFENLRPYGWLIIAIIGILIFIPEIKNIIKKLKERK